MDCHAEPQAIASSWKLGLKELAFVMHASRAALFIIVMLLDPVSYFLFVWFCFFELVVARWLWSLRMEAWGIAMGLCFFHLLLPVVSSISIIVSSGILLLSVTEVFILFLIRKEGFFNFSKLAKYNKDSITQPMNIQRNVFYLIIAAQFFKAIFVIMGTYIVFYVEGFSGSIPWLFNMPRVPLLLALAGIDSAVILGLYAGKEWAFHITIVMTVVGFVETLFAWMPLIILISVWIIILMLPCWAKDGFYLRFIKSHK
jgi:hypothetical protein